MAKRLNNLNIVDLIYDIETKIMSENKSNEYFTELVKRISDIRNNKSLRNGTSEEELFIYDLIDMDTGEIEYKMHSMEWCLYQMTLGQIELELRNY